MQREFVHANGGKNVKGIPMSSISRKPQKASSGERGTESAPPFTKKESQIRPSRYSDRVRRSNGRDRERCNWKIKNGSAMIRADSNPSVTGAPAASWCTLCGPWNPTGIYGVTAIVVDGIKIDHIGRCNEGESRVDIWMTGAVGTYRLAPLRSVMWTPLLIDRIRPTII